MSVWQDFLAWTARPGYGDGFTLGWLLGAVFGIGVGALLFRRVARNRRMAAMWAEVDRTQQAVYAEGYSPMFKIVSPDHADGVGSSVTFEVTEEMVAACRNLDLVALRPLLPIPPDARDQNDFAATAMHMLRASAPMFTPEERDLSRRWLDEQNKELLLARSTEPPAPPVDRRKLH